MSFLIENLRVVQERIQAAAKRSGRLVHEVRLIGVTKGVEVEKIQEAVEAGMCIFGENYVQEAKEKIAAITKKVAWHMIGHLQKNKVNDAIRLFNVIETVDDHRLAEKLDKRAKIENRVLEIFVQANVSGEASKSGVNPDRVLFLVEDIVKRKNLRIGGLMTIAPFFEDPEMARPYFGALRELRNTVLSEGLTGTECIDLSMGMSGDFEVAIEEGATIVRIGTAIFGPRINSQ